ncbi:MAG: coproporphyrinogen III oxidase, partial [Gammaproteobacteria bacterium]|nr:coproporphyrinogen III oxidase [Gammaproteobacteria bacterium]
MHSHPVDTEVLVIDQALLSRYDKTGPRYTSYPTAVQFTDDFSDSDYIQATALSNVAPSKPLSLYFHIPFCATLCFYCACNKVVTKNRDRATEYLKYLYTEIAMQGELYDDERVV